jgi:Archaeal ATPase.
MAVKNPKMYAVGSVFTPSAPIGNKDLFSGRSNQIDSVINAIIQRSQHAVIYGERGVGKTSLANVIKSFLPSDIEMGILTIRVHCDAATSFQSLFEAILDEIKVEYRSPGIGFSADDIKRIETLRAVLGDKTIDPNQLRFLFRDLQNKIIIIIDEFDRIEDQGTKRLVADTIKNFSDYALDTTFVLVGVADSVNELIAEHLSVERALVQVQMPRMSRKELRLIVDMGLKKLGMTIKEEAMERILKLSQGLPHYTHSLGFYAAQSAISAGRDTVLIADVDKATAEAIHQAQQSIKESYHKAVTSPRGNLYPQVLLACAMAANDERGYFAAGSIKEPLSKILKKNTEISAFNRHLKEFCDKSRGPIIQKVGSPRRYRYRFANPLMEPFVIMKGLTEGLIADGDIT